MTKISELSREVMVDRMVDLDMDSILNWDDGHTFLDSVLRGHGWVPYNQLTDEQVRQEFLNRDWPDLEDEDE